MKADLEFAYCIRYCSRFARITRVPPPPKCNRCHTSETIILFLLYKDCHRRDLLPLLFIAPDRVNCASGEKEGASYSRPNAQSGDTGFRYS